MYKYNNRINKNEIKIYYNIIILYYIYIIFIMRFLLDNYTCTDGGLSRLHVFELKDEFELMKAITSSNEIIDTFFSPIGHLTEDNKHQYSCCSVYPMSFTESYFAKNETYGKDIPTDELSDDFYLSNDSEFYDEFRNFYINNTENFQSKLLLNEIKNSICESGLLINPSIIFTNEISNIITSNIPQYITFSKTNICDQYDFLYNLKLDINDNRLTSVVSSVKVY